MSNIMTAHHEWANRPADERFQSLDDMERAVTERKYDSHQYGAFLQDLEIVEENGELLVDTPMRRAKLNNWSFSALAKHAEVPADYLQRIPPRLVIENVKYGLEKNKDKEIQVYEGTEKLRALTSPNYTRIFDSDVIRWIKPLVERTTFKLPMQYKDGKWGAPLVPGGAYASDRDMFLFMVDDEHKITVGKEELGRGFFLWNSEVGSKSFGIETFLYRYVCNNNIVWGAQQHRKFRTIHVGATAGERAAQALETNLKLYVNGNTQDDVKMIEAARTQIVAKNAEEAVEWLVNRKFSKKLAEKAVQFAEVEEGGCDSVWRLVQGLTSYAKTIKHTDQRILVEREAGKLLG